MVVDILQASPLELLVKAIRKCYESEDKSDSAWDFGCDSETGNYISYFVLGDKDKALIEKIIVSGHTSTLEHLVFSFDIDGLSRAALQELARHRLASYSVKSTRYTLKKLGPNDCQGGECGSDNCPMLRSIVPSGNERIDHLSARTVCDALDIIKQEGLSNDVGKYGIPEALKTSLIMTINARSLRNFFELRSSARALREMQELACKLYNALPFEMKFLFADCM